MLGDMVHDRGAQEILLLSASRHDEHNWQNLDEYVLKIAVHPRDSPSERVNQSPHCLTMKIYHAQEYPART